MLSLLGMALDSFQVVTSSPGLGSTVVRDAGCVDDPSRFGPGEIDRQQPILQVRAQHLHSVREHKGALELARRNAAVEIVSGLVVLLTAADDELAFLDRHVELIARESGYRQRDAQAFRTRIVASDPLDVV